MNLPGGELRIPADLARTRRVLIQMLPKGSLKFLSDAQLRSLAEHFAKESNRQPIQPGAQERPELSRYLKDWAVQYGFSVERSSHGIEPLGCSMSFPEVERI